MWLVLSVYLDLSFDEPLNSNCTDGGFKKQTGRHKVIVSTPCIQPALNYFLRVWLFFLFLFISVCPTRKYLSCFTAWRKCFVWKIRRSKISAWSIDIHTFYLMYKSSVYCRYFSITYNYFSCVQLVFAAAAALHHHLHHHPHPLKSLHPPPAPWCVCHAAHALSRARAVHAYTAQSTGPATLHAAYQPLPFKDLSTLLVFPLHQLWDLATPHVYQSWCHQFGHHQSLFRRLYQTDQLSWITLWGDLRYS